MNQHASLNRFYRLVWSVATQTWHAVSEITRGQGKGSGRRSRTVAGAAVTLTLAASGSLALGQQAPPALNQLPTGASVSAGTARISNQVTSSSATMTISQSTPRAVINWSSFNVGQNASVNFQQPGATSVTLNKITDQNPSQVFGQIQSNGQVWLSNPAGIYFSPTARVDVGALMATTHTMSDPDFMAGNASLARQGATGSVVNEGHLQSALGGYIALLAPEVRNAGVVVARAGTVAMASGEMVSLQFDGNQSLTGILTTPSSIASLIENRQAVQAPDGQIILSAMALNQLQAGVIRNTGVLEASSLSQRGGKLVLEADQIELKTGSNLQANGATGGGTVLVGGDWQGSGTLRPATTVQMERGASIEANAVRSGNGGKVVLWSDVSNPQSVTDVHGQISAKGGADSGNGGQIETSGHKLHASDIRVSTSAPNGTAGQWLLDPDSITIAPSGGDITGADLSTALASGSVNIQTNVNFMGSGWLVNATGMVNIYPTNNATISSQQSCLTCDIIINDNISWTNPGSALVLNAGGVIYGTGNITVGGTITASPNYWGGPYTVSGIPSAQSIGALIRFSQNGDSVARGVSYSGSISGTISQSMGGYTFTASPPIEFTGEGGKFVMSGNSPIASPRITVNKGGSLIFTGPGGFTSPSATYTLGDWQGSQTGHTGTLDFSGRTGDLTVAQISTQGAGSSTVAMGPNSLTIALSSSSSYASYGYDQTISANGLVFNNFAGVISGTGGVNITMPNYMPGTFPSGMTFSGVNTYSGPTVVGANARLGIKGGGSIANSSSVTANGILDIGIATSSVSVNNLSGSGEVYLNTPTFNAADWMHYPTPYVVPATAGKTLQVNDNSGSGSVFSGALSGTGNLTVATGTQILTGANTYTGATQVNSGATLQLGSGGTTGSLNAGSTITVDGTLAIKLSSSPTLNNTINGAGLVTNLGTGSTVLGGTVANTIQTSHPAGNLCIGPCPFDITTLTTLAQIQALSSSDISGMTSADIQLMTATQLGYFTNAQLALWSNTQLALLSPVQLAGLTVSQIPSLTTTQLGLWNATQIAGFSTTQLTALTGTQVIALTGTQLGGLSASQIAALHTADLIASQWSGLTTTQLTSLSAAQIAALNSTQLAALTATQLTSLGNSQLTALSGTQLAGLSNAQTAALTASQIASLSTAQIAGLTQVAGLTSVQMAALTASQVAALTTTQLGTLSAAQIAALSATQLGALSTTQVAALTTAQLALLTASQISSLSNAQLGALTASQIAALDILQSVALTANQIGSLSNAQVGALTAAQLNSLSAAQVAGFSATQLAAMSQNQLSALSVTAPSTSGSTSSSSSSTGSTSTTNPTVSTGSGSSNTSSSASSSSNATGTTGSTSTTGSTDTTSPISSSVSTLANSSTGSTSATNTTVSMGSSSSSTSSSASSSSTEAVATTVRETINKIQGAIGSSASNGVRATVASSIAVMAPVEAVMPAVESLIMSLAPAGAVVASGSSTATTNTTGTSTTASSTSTTSSNSKERPVVASKWQAGAQNRGGTLEVQLPNQVMGTAGSTSVVVQLPSSVVAQVAAGAPVKLNAMDNSAAPSWVQYSPQQGGLVIGNVPAGALPTQIRMLVGQQQLMVQLNAPTN